MSVLSAADIAEGHRLNAALASAPWFPYVNDLIGGHCVMSVDKWPSETGPGGVVADFINADTAEAIAWMRNHLPALLDAAEKVAELDYRQAMRLAEHGPGHSPQERWREASRAARASEHHWPADCLAEAADVLDSLMEERAAVRAIANGWATQGNDYDEDAEQQIADGREILGLLGEEVVSGE